MDPLLSRPRIPQRLSRYATAIGTAIGLSIVLVSLILEWKVFFFAFASICAVLLGLAMWHLARRARVVRNNPAFRAGLPGQTITVSLAPAHALKAVREAIVALPDTTLLDNTTRGKSSVLAKQAMTWWRPETHTQAEVLPDGTGSRVEIESWVPYQSVITSIGKCQRNVNRVVATLLATEGVNSKQSRDSS